jgi:hypothetical protein
LKKNLSPKQLAVIAAILIAGFGVLFIPLLENSIGKYYWGIYLATFFILILVVAYFIISEMLTFFIDRRIKLIYKTIRTIKTPKNQPLEQ